MLGYQTTTAPVAKSVDVVCPLSDGPSGKHADTRQKGITNTHLGRRGQSVNLPVVSGISIGMDQRLLLAGLKKPTTLTRTTTPYGSSRSPPGCPIWKTWLSSATTPLSRLRLIEGRNKGGCDRGIWLRVAADPLSNPQVRVILTGPVLNCRSLPMPPLPQYAQCRALQAHDGAAWAWRPWPARWGSAGPSIAEQDSPRATSFRGLGTISPAALIN